MNFIIGAAGGQIPNPEEYTRRYASQQGKSIDEAKQYLKTEIDNVQGVDNNQSSIIGGTSIWTDGKQEKPNKKTNRRHFPKRFLSLYYGFQSGNTSTGAY